MGLDAALDVVPDGTEGQFTFEGSEGGFHTLRSVARIGARGHRGPWDRDWCARDRRPAQLGSPQTRFIPRPRELATSMFHRAEHGPALGITLFESAKSALDFAWVLEASASHNAAQRTQRAVQAGELNA